MGEFDLDKGLQSFMISNDLFNVTCGAWQYKNQLLKTLSFDFRVFDIVLLSTYKGEKVVQLITSVHPMFQGKGRPVGGEDVKLINGFSHWYKSLPRHFYSGLVGFFFFFNLD